MMTARDFFEAKLRFETDVADVAAALASGVPAFVLVDSRNDAAWWQGHLPGATHIPTALIDELIGRLDPGIPIVTYCWGPGCNGATRSAAAFAARGFEVREMLGGFEYWAREGFEVHGADGAGRRIPDPLTAPVGAALIGPLSGASVLSESGGSGEGSVSCGC
ncbi:MAG: sulfurtransferase [Frankiales bacterium]|nr:sulfurtransferase [Frankiales bacterium]